MSKINAEYAAGKYTGATKDLADQFYAENEYLQSYLPMLCPTTTVTFKADGVVVDVRTYAVDSEEIVMPEVPAKTGYTGEWENFTLTPGSIEVNAIYTVKTTDTLEFTKTNATKWGNYLLEDTDSGVKISKAAWEPAATYTFASAIDVANIDTVTVRFKQENAIAIMYFGSVYVEVGSGATKYAASSKIDDQGFTVLTLDAAAIIAANPSFTTLMDVKLGTSSASGSAVFDYLTVTYKGPNDTIKFTVAKMSKWGNYALSDTDNGVKVSGWAWDPPAIYNLPTAIETTTINTVTIRFKQENAVAFIYLDTIYVEIGSGAAKYAIGSEVDEQGFTILTLDIAKIIADKPAFTTLGAIKLGTSSSSGSAIFDYVVVTYK